MIRLSRSLCAPAPLLFRGWLPQKKVLLNPTGVAAADQCGGER